MSAAQDSVIGMRLAVHMLVCVRSAVSRCLHRPTTLSTAMLVPHLLQKRAHVQGKHLQPHSVHSGAGAGAAGVTTVATVAGVTTAAVVGVTTVAGSHSRGRRQPGNHAGGALGMGRWAGGVTTAVGVTTVAGVATVMTTAVVGVTTVAGCHSTRGRRQPGNHGHGAMGSGRGEPWSPRGSSMPIASDVQNAAVPV